MTIRALAAAAVAAGVVASSASAEVTRPVEPAAPGPAVFTLDRDVYENAREDLGDLRVVDDEGRETPYLLARADERTVASVRPAMTDASFVRGQRAMVTLDFGAPTLKIRSEARWRAISERYCISSMAISGARARV